MLHQLDVTVRWILGVSLCFLNLALSSAGFIMQRKAHLVMEQQGLASETRISPSTISPRRLLHVGIFLYIVACVPDVVAYMLVPQVVCVTVACCRMVVLTVLAHHFLQERLHRRVIFGMAICTLGTVVCISFGPRPSDFTAAVAGEFYHPEVSVYLVVGLSILAILLVVEHIEALSFCRGHVSKNVHHITLPTSTGIAFAFEKVFNTELGFLDPPKGLPLGLLMQPHWTSVLVAIAVLGLLDFYLNLRGARRMPLQVFAPLVFVFCTSLQYFQSVFVFHELRDLSAVDARLSLLGACGSLLGSLIINPPRLRLLGRELVDNEEIDKMQKQEKVGQGGTVSPDPTLCYVSGTGGDVVEQGQGAAKSSCREQPSSAFCTSSCCSSSSSSSSEEQQSSQSRDFAVVESTEKQGQVVAKSSCREQPSSAFCASSSCFSSSSSSTGD